MLFHVTIRHDAAHCPGFHRELMEPTIEAFENVEATAAQMGVKVIGLYSGLPDHVDFIIAEAESPADVAFFLSAAGLYGEIAETETHAVVTAGELVEAGKQMAASQAGGP